MSRFSQDSNYNSQANFRKVKIGAGSQVLETELNELQDIAYHRQRQFIQEYLGDGLMYRGNLSYQGGFLTIDNEVAVVGGNLIEITHLSVEIFRGQKAYIKVWEQEVSYVDQIKLQGNNQEARIVPNTLMDERVSEETTRRIQVMYDLVTERPQQDESNTYYLELGILEQDAFKVTVKYLGRNATKFSYSCVATEGQTFIDFDHPYAFGKNSMVVHVDGKVLLPSQFTEIDAYTVKMNIDLHEGQVVYCYAENYLQQQRDDGHNQTHSWDGNDPIDIRDLQDPEELLHKLRGLTGKIEIDGGGFSDLDSERDIVYNGGSFTDDSDILDSDIQITPDTEFQIRLQGDIIQYRRAEGEEDNTTLWRDLVDLSNYIEETGEVPDGLVVVNNQIYLAKDGEAIGTGRAFPTVPSISSGYENSTTKTASARSVYSLKQQFDMFNGTIDGINQDITDLSGDVEALQQTVEGLGTGTGSGGSVDTTQLRNELQNYINDHMPTLPPLSDFVGKTANILGDSQTEANYHKTKIWIDWLKEELGLATVNNYGVSGTTITKKSSSDTTAFCVRYANMSTNADLIIVMGGVNDVWFNSSLGTMSDTGQLTFYGAMHTLCQGLLARYPGKRIVFITPTEQNNTNCNNANTTGLTATDFANAMKIVCAKYSIPVFDANTCLGVYPYDSGARTQYTTDGLHLNDLGNKVLGINSARFIKSGCASSITTLIVQQVINNVITTGGGGTGTGGDTPIVTPSLIGRTVNKISQRYAQVFHLTFLLKADSDWVNGATVSMTLKGSGVAGLETKGEGNEGGTIFKDSTGLLNNVDTIDVTPVVSNSVKFSQTVTNGNITFGIPNRTLNATVPSEGYVKVPVMIQCASATAFSFNISELSIKVNNIEKTPIAVGGYFIDEVCSIS